MLIPSATYKHSTRKASLSRRVNANSQLAIAHSSLPYKLIKKGEC